MLTYQACLQTAVRLHDAQQNDDGAACGGTKRCLAAEAAGESEHYGTWHGSCDPEDLAFRPVSGNTSACDGWYVAGCCNLGTTVLRGCCGQGNPLYGCGAVFHGYPAKPSVRSSVSWWQEPNGALHRTGDGPGW